MLRMDVTNVLHDGGDSREATMGYFWDEGVDSIRLMGTVHDSLPS